MIGFKKVRLCRLSVFNFFGGARPRRCKSKDSSRAASFAQNPMSQTKLTTPKHLKFRSSLFKGLWESKGQSPWSLPQERNSPAQSNEQSKSNNKAKQNYKIKKRNAAKKGKTERCNVSYNLSKNQLICIALILYYQTKLPLL